MKKQAYEVLYLWFDKNGQIKKFHGKEKEREKSTLTT
jgi:hypothetical protein